jgi:putative DNA primase/helicase
MKKPNQNQPEKPLFISPELQPEGDASQSRQRALFATEPTVGATILLDRAEPYEIARRFVTHKYCRYGHLGLYHKGEGFWQFNGSFYEEKEFDVLSAEVYSFMNAAKCRYRNNAIPMIVKPDEVANVIKCIKAGTTIPAKLPQPCWIGTEKRATELFAFKNRLVNVYTGETLAPTPLLWITDAVNFNYDPSAECPRWKQFLEEIHPNDPDAQNCLEEQLGYGMTYDMQFEKIFTLIGKSRAGKSTLIHVLRGLVGARSFASLSFNDWMRGEYSKENLIGKKVVVFSDTRLKPGQFYGRSYDPGGLDHRSVELLLKISGRDSTSIGRKWKKAFEDDLFCKVWVTSNNPVNITDQILLGRLVIVDFQQSWAHRDDRDEHLREKLDAELPGIANCCLAAYRQLLERKGGFKQPASATRLAQEIAANTNPIAAFMQEYWIKDDKAKPGPLAAHVHSTFEMWCEEHRRCNLLETYPRGQELMKAIKGLAEFSWLERVRSHGETAGHYPGIRRRTKEDRKKEEEEAAEEEVAKEETVVKVPKTYRRF